MAAELAETHISIVVMTGERVYKFLKPVDLGFVDFTTTEARLRAVRDEVELNSRFAPDVYLGTGEVREGGVRTDAFVVMRRLPADRRLAMLVATGADGVEDCVRDVARTIAAFHESCEPDSHAAEMASIDAVSGRWHDSFVTLEPFVGSVLPADEVERVRDLVDRYLDGRTALFERRIHEGHARDGHGDLRAEDTFCLPDGPRIIDCLAFDRDLRVGDVLCDVAFMAMDLERLGGPDLASRFMAWYAEYAAAPFPASLADHYVAYRAHVRAKVACLRAAGADGDADAAEEARQLHHLAAERLERARTRVVVVGGTPATGKSTIAARLADELGSAALSSDVVRKQLAGMASTAHADTGLDEGIYGGEWTARVYDELAARAETLAAQGESVVLDATWSDGAHRDAVRAAAGRVSADVVELRCDAPEELVVDRIAERRRRDDTSSDATVEVARHVRATFDPWPEATMIDTAAPVDRSVQAALDAVVSGDPGGIRDR